MKRIMRQGLLVVVALSFCAWGIDLSAGNDAFPAKRGRIMKRRGMRQNGHPQNRADGRFSQVMSRLTEEERNELAELRKTDKEAFRNKIRELAKKYKRQFAAERKQMNELAKKIRKATSEDEKSKLKDELRSILRKQFDAKMAINRRNYEQAAKRLKDLKKRLDARQKKADQIIERKLQDLTEDPDLKW